MTTTTLPRIELERAQRARTARETYRRIHRAMRRRRHRCMPPDSAARYYASRLRRRLPELHRIAVAAELAIAAWRQPSVDPLTMATDPRWGLLKLHCIQQMRSMDLWAPLR